MLTTQNRTRPRGRLVAGAAALSLGVGGMLMAGGAAAFAAPAAPVAGPVKQVTDGSITIHKHAEPGLGTTANPDGSTTAAGSPLAGVTFEVCQIAGIDLVNGGNAAWTDLRTTGTAAASLAPGATSINGHALSCSGGQVTDANGITTFGSLATGAYLVRETAAPASVSEKAAPFVVSVPTPAVGADAGKWLYDVHVYPKNQVVDAPEKTVTVNGPTVGDTVTYKISQTLPGLKDGDSYNKIVFTDTLDARLTGNLGSVKVTVNGVDRTGDFTATLVGQLLTVTAKTPASFSQGDKIVVSFDATVTSAGNGTIENTALVNVNDLGTGAGGNNEAKVTEWYGPVKIKKVASGSRDGLAGAEFDLYETSKPDCTTTTAVNPAEKTGKTVTSGADGTLNISWLYVGDDSKDGAGNQPNNMNTRCYYLVETKAPAGYVIDSNLKAFVVDRTATVGSVTPIGGNGNGEVLNQQELIPGLPLTGGQGAAMLLVIGGALTAAGVGGVLLSRKRRQVVEA